MDHTKKIALLILDGWGLGPKPSVDAIKQARTPYIDGLLEQFPHGTLITYGESVGLPDGQMGNSEVGHLNIGAGRVVYQELARINKAIRERTLHQDPTLLAALQFAKSNNRKVHLMGLVSDGGVHSHTAHLNALCDICVEQGLDKVFIHAFTDGRDTDPKSGKGFLEGLLKHIAGGPCQLATVIGRYYAMDRDKRWERVKLAYDLLVKAEGIHTTDILSAVEARYAEGETDEFLHPLVVVDAHDQPLTRMENGDVLICFNFRTDRPREISEVLTQQDFPDFGMKKLDMRYVTMTRYDARFKNIDVIFQKDDIKNTLGEVLSQAGKTQVRIAETEKYPHVTFFFNGGREQTFEGERRIMIPSPKVATYDLQPEMSAPELTEAIVADIKVNQPDFICLNFANTDMVGHTGVFAAAVKAAEVVDHCVEQIVKTGLQQGYEFIIIADHGNSDYMINEDGSPNTAHTMNPVPCIFVSNHGKQHMVQNGKLGDLAPTILSRLGLDIPAEMDGEILIK
ncbi:MAG: 2,3-bisphosphoglycerate-independent phosphoglycerate mutase [Saprospiraceae bacterium]|nr:2,3-bisphosphoglycerate-independent phosphoglycerate mutase [Saprospiraceae bacterium]